MRRHDKNITAAEMGRALGVSAERVRQHLVALGLPTHTARTDPLRGSRMHGDVDLEARINVALRRIRATLRNVEEALELLSPYYSASRPPPQSKREAQINVAVRKIRGALQEIEQALDVLADGDPA
jgi:hypothetical protein